MNTLSFSPKAEAQLHFDQMVEYRRHLHKNPEISYKEFETTRFIIQTLEKLNCRIEQPLETGCIAIFEGPNSNGECIALRADIDALQMEEYGEAKTDFLSTKEMAAHCCGHDAHTANLLGAAHIIHKHLDKLPHKVVLVFQPGEEKLPGGGRLLTEEGSLTRHGVQRIYGLHTYPHADPGTVLTRPNECMARPDEFEVTFIGKGGHAAAPHRTVDTIAMASQFVNTLQSVVSRNTDPTEYAVITVGSLHAGHTYNVIPEKAEIKGTIRSFSEQTAKLLSKRAQEVAEGIAQTYGGQALFRYKPGYPAVMNDPETTEHFFDLAKEVLGEQGVALQAKPIMAGEDFAFYQQQFPGTFFFLGSGSEACDARWDWHHPQYNVDEKALLTGAAMMSALAFRG